MAIPSDVLAKIERRVAYFTNVRPFEWRSERPIVSCTFDDFAASAWHNAGPILDEFSARATYYVCGGLLGKVLDGVNLATAEDLRAVATAGHEIGCHTHSHVCLQGLTAHEIEEQIDKNSASVQAVLPEYLLRTFAYPYGATDRNGKRTAATRFEAARSVWPGINRRKLDLMALRTHSVRRVGGDVVTARTIISETRRVNGWLVLYTHDVDKNPSGVGCTPEQLATILKAACDADCKLLPVAEALESVRAIVTASV